MRKLIPLLSLVLAVALVNATENHVRAASEPDLERLRNQVQKKLSSLKAEAAFPGATVGFILADGRSTGVSVGLADLENKTPLKPTDRLLAGSIGKTFVAAVALQLVEEGKIGLRTSLSVVRQGAVVRRLPNAHDLTIRNDDPLQQLA